MPKCTLGSHTGGRGNRGVKDIRDDFQVLGESKQADMVPLVEFCPGLCVPSSAQAPESQPGSHVTSRAQPTLF